MMTEARDETTRALEAVLFVAAEPVPSTVLAQLVEVDRPRAEEALRRLAESYERASAGIRLRNVAGGWRLSTDASVAPAVERFILASKHSRLTKAALETLAIVAYKQPVTRHQVASIRGVNSDGVLTALVERGLLAEVGRDDGPGRPLLHGTTPDFLERLGLASVGDLPALAPLLGRGDEEQAVAEGSDEGAEAGDAGGDAADG